MADVSLISPANSRAWKAGVRSPFPHMSEKDSAVWAAFLASGFVTVRRADYDLAVGGKSLAAIPEDHELRDMWETLIRKRIDVVAETSRGLWIVEVKPLGNMSALGQILAYSFLWNSERRSRGRPIPVVVCARIDEDMEPVFVNSGVSVIVVSLAAGGDVPRVLHVYGPLASDR